VKIPLTYQEYKNQQGKSIYQHEPEHHQLNLRGGQHFDLPTESPHP